MAALGRQVAIVGLTDGLMALLLVAALLLGGRWTWTSRPPAQRAQRLLPWVWVRYLLPLLPVLSWLAWRAGECWCLGHEGRPGGTVGPRVARRAAVLGATLALLVLAQNLAVYRSLVLPQVRSFSPGLQASLVPWGKWLRTHAPARASVATPDIGAIGFYGQRRVVDLAGLVTPEMVPYLEREVPEQAIANFRFAAFARPVFLIDRGPRPDDLRQRSRFAPALELLDVTSVPNLGIARPGRAFYSLYRVDWAKADSIFTPR